MRLDFTWTHFGCSTFACWVGYWVNWLISLFHVRKLWYTACPRNKLKTSSLSADDDWRECSRMCHKMWKIHHFSLLSVRWFAYIDFQSHKWCVWPKWTIPTNRMYRVYFGNKFHIYAKQFTEWVLSARNQSTGLNAGSPAVMKKRMRE